MIRGSILLFWATL